MHTTSSMSISRGSYCQTTALLPLPKYRFRDRCTLCVHVCDSYWVIWRSDVWESEDHIES